jgi:hypothetical protein
MLYHTLRKRGHFTPDAQLRRRAPRWRWPRWPWDWCCGRGRAC